MPTLNEFIARAWSYFDKAESTTQTATAELTKVQNDLAASTSENTKLKSQITESAERIKSLEAALSAKDIEIAGLKTELDKSKTSAAETIAAQGIPADQLPDAGKGSQSKAPTVADQWLAITDPKSKTEFFRAHEAEIKAQWRK